MRPPSSSNEFQIQGGGNEFVTRQKQMFEQLSQAAKKFNKFENCQSLTEAEMQMLRQRSMPIRSPHSFLKKKRNETLQYCGKESIFKRPEGPAPMKVRKSIPDHHRHPQKWTKYSLEDVQTEQMSDRSNAQAAFSFLRELRARKSIEDLEREKDMEITTDGVESENQSTSSIRCKSTTHIPFRKIAKRKTEKEQPVVIVERPDRPIFQNSKIILPEYVVGQKQEKVKVARSAVKVDRTKQLRLDHLEEIDE
ncbi:protein TSSC4 [Venturia canescens]|uniref:protein TSSC4 n=1 Tax=Venturia canescens TaxID=32260 RepID=UPI001C9C4E6A|nr:protein TSSC4 [Venturia canescens]XP_043281392.1 protein TSSC4 [Venturia canescens]